MLKLFNFSKSRVNHVCRCISTTSTQWQGGELTKTEDKGYGIKAIEKKPQRLPLVKNFFLSRIDTDLLAFPEAIYENDHLASANSRKKEYEDFMESIIFENPDDVNNIRKMKEFGCFRRTSPVLTETLTSISEPETKYLSYSTFLNNHQKVLNLINEFAEASQKLKYLPKLESGEYIAVPCMFEAKRPTTNKKTFCTEVTFDDQTNQYTINGKKDYVLLSPAHKDSALFLVIASHESVDHIGDFQEGLIALLVDGNTPGVTISSVDETFGISEKALNQVSVTFKDVSVGKTCLLAEDGFNVATRLMTSLRLDKGIQALCGVMKPILNKLVSHSINTTVMGTPLKDIEIVKERLGALATNCYALESMIYFTSGLIDIYEKQDVDVECAMVQSFAVQMMSDFMVRPLHSIGPDAVIKGSGFERLIRDAAHLSASGEQLDSIRQFIALSGMSYAGISLHESIRKTRNPFDHPAFMFSRFFKQTSIERPKKRYELEGFLHPSLHAAATFIELSILRLGVAADILLARHGPLIGQKSVEASQLADAGMLCFAMFTTAARASRSYCIGLRNADQEIFLANQFCFTNNKRVKQIAKDIDDGEYGTSENTHKTIGEKLIESKSYHLEHPTTRNF